MKNYLKLIASYSLFFTTTIAFVSCESDELEYKNDTSSIENIILHQKIEITEIELNNQVIKVEKNEKQYTLKIDVNGIALPVGFIDRKGNNPSVVTVVTDTIINTDANKKANATETGTITGLVYNDINLNSTQDIGESGLENVPVTITDINNKEQITYTDASGSWSAPLAIKSEELAINNNEIPTYTSIKSTNPIMIRMVLATDTKKEISEFQENNNLPEITVQNTLSPNGDGNEDEMIISGIEFCSYNKLTLFNKWSQTIFETTEYGKNGNVFKGYGNNGALLPSGTYTYVLEYEYENILTPTMNKSGHLYLKR